jgi:hypothetical protein
MSTVKIDPRFEEWVTKNVVKGFGLHGIEVTPTARRGIAFLMQAQLDEGTFHEEDQVTDGAKKLLPLVLMRHQADYKDAPLTINRVLHLVTHANSSENAFPWGVTMQLPREKKEPVTSSRANTYKVRS